MDKIKDVLFILNNLFRKDSRINQWANYIDERGRLRTDVYFKDYDNTLRDYHNIVDPIEFKHIPTDVVAEHIWLDMQRTYEKDVIKGE